MLSFLRPCLFILLVLLINQTTAADYLTRATAVDIENTELTKKQRLRSSRFPFLGGDIIVGSHTTGGGSSAGLSSVGGITGGNSNTQITDAEYVALQNFLLSQLALVGLRNSDFASYLGDSAFFFWVSNGTLVYFLPNQGGLLYTDPLQTEPAHWLAYTGDVSTYTQGISITYTQRAPLTNGLNNNSSPTLATPLPGTLVMLLSGLTSLWLTRKMCRKNT